MSAESAVGTARPPRKHRRHRPGFHWQTPGVLAPHVVYAPVPWDGEVDGAESGFLSADDPGFRVITGRLGRDGRTPVEHLDVLLHLDAMAPWPRTELGLPSGESLVGVTAGAAPLLRHCRVRKGALSLADSGDGPRVTWEPGTTLLVEDLPRTSVDRLPSSWYSLARSSDDDPADTLRREAFLLLGTRYHSDIPPAPRDARSADFTGQDRRGHEHVPTEYPGWADSAEVFLDEREAAIVVRRFGSAGHGTQYVLPATAGRLDLIRRMREEYLYSASAYASVGADPGAAATLAGTPWNPVALRRLLPVMAVRTAVDAACLISGTPDSWRRQGWPVDAADDSGPGRDVPSGGAARDAEPENAWRAGQAEALAAAGITAERAYELRSAGFLSVRAAISADATRPTAAARDAEELVGTSETPVPAKVAAELARARAHDAEETRSWGRDHHESCSIEGWGVWVTLTRHRFVLPSGDVRTVWDVTNGWWAISDEGDEGRSRCLFTDVRQAMSAWRTTRAELQAYEARFLEERRASSV
ncbi:hypothetical protein [Streptomyces liangshanensis]|uniref:hypothetical protein n=1 Tax=Streptomyces liangshanensis TaxID=2717324 RepID=UPI0036DD5C06